eukprot:5423413-Amphidinium_carterae.1
MAMVCSDGLFDLLAKAAMITKENLSTNVFVRDERSSGPASLILRNTEPVSLTTYALRRMMASCAHAFALAEENQDAIGNWVDRGPSFYPSRPTSQV